MNFSEKIEAVAIDGPAGSGKSTVSRLVAESLGYVYIDTGAMYRALTLKAMRECLDLGDEEGLVRLSENFDLDMVKSEEPQHTICVIMDGEDVSEDIRRPDVTANVKYVARISGVRKNLVRMQKDLAVSSGGAVMEGRDITTVVLPDAAHKFYLDASFEKRVKRRFMELRSKGVAVEKKELWSDLETRDQSDRTRKTGPLRKSEDATVIDTTDMSVDQVVDKIVSEVRRIRK